MQKLKSEIDNEKNKLSILQREGKLSEAGELAREVIRIRKQLSNLEEQKTQNNMLSNQSLHLK